MFLYNFFPIVADLVGVGIFLYNRDIVDGALIGELARRKVSKSSNAVRLLRYNSQIYYASEFKAFIKLYRCLSSDQFFKESRKQEKH